MLFWVVILSTALAFGLGFALAWQRMRRQLQARMDREVEAEIRRQIQARVLNELSNGKMQQHVAAAQRGEPASPTRSQHE